MYKLYKGRDLSMFITKGIYLVLASIAAYATYVMCRDNGFSLAIIMMGLIAIMFFCFLYRNG